MSFEGVQQARERIWGHIHETPVLTSSTIDDVVGRKVFFKCENFQKTGSFKARGALNAVLHLKKTDPNSPGVVTHSSGNHAHALAWSAAKYGLPCTVVVPNITSPVKCQGIAAHGAKIVYCEPTVESRFGTSAAISKKQGMTYISTFDDYDVIYGQGTLAIEFLEQVPQLDAILVPVAGGGMVSGVAIAAKNIKPSIKIYAVEAKEKGLERSLRAGEKLWPMPPRFLKTIADGLRPVGDKTFDIIRRYVEKDVFSVTDDEMIDAMKFTWERMKLVIEVSSAAGVAAVMSERMKTLDPSIKNVGVILCGGNVDLDNLPWLNKD